MPVARTFGGASAAAVVANAINGANEPSAEPASEAAGEGEQDDKTYCFCDGVSYGEMIACDNKDCAREWVRLLFVCDLAPYG